MRVILFLYLTSSVSLAAVPGNSSSKPVDEALKMPHKWGVQSLKSKGSTTFEQLSRIAFDDDQPMQKRWKSFMLLTEIKGKSSFTDIKKALMSKTWFMRSAGLTALEKVDPLAANKWAYAKLQSDPALMVRMKALEILKDETNHKVTELFWEKLNSADSRHKNKSLWIRGDIARILVARAQKKDLTRWVQLLHESDVEMQKIASVALSKIHKGSEAGTNVSLRDWQQRFPKSKTL